MLIDAEKAVIYHTLSMLIKLEAERTTSEGKKEILNSHATLLQDMGIRLGGSMADVYPKVTDGRENQRRIDCDERIRNGLN